MDDGKNIKTAYKCWPLIRNEYRKCAFNAYKSGDFDRAILNDSKSLSCGFVGIHLDVDHDSSTKIDQTIESTIHLQQKTGSSLVDFLSDCMSGIQIGESNKTNSEISDQIKVTELYEKCAKLPSQWNVIQLNQSYDGYNGYSTKKDVYTSDGLMTITLHRYNLEEKRNNRSFGLVFDLNELHPKSILSTAYEIHQVMYKNYVASMSTPAYADFMKSLTHTQSKLVAEIKLWLGPWITLFSGKIKGKTGEDFESKIFDGVAKLCQEFDNFPDDQLVLLSLVARRIDLLDSENIRQAAHDIGRNQKEYSRIIEFLAQLKVNLTFKDFTYYPSILVIDEILDPLPWEMILTGQEFARVHSIYMLLDLYERYQEQIQDGYLHVNVKNGFAVIDPNNDEKLNDMFQRMHDFYNEYLPNWERIERVIPNSEQLANGFKNIDLFVYSGHGSSLQYFTDPSENIQTIKHNGIMLLFGCDSIAMKPRGTVCEAACPSYSFFCTGCPGMLGSLTIVTDIWVDCISLLVLTQWVLSKNVKHPTIGVCKDKHSLERVQKILQKITNKRDPNLLAVLSYIRNEQDISIRMRSAMVYRGLPPYNTAVEK